MKEEIPVKQNVLQSIIGGFTDCAIVDLASEIYKYRAESGLLSVSETTLEQKTRAILDIADLCKSENPFPIIKMIDEAAAHRDHDGAVQAARLKTDLGQLENAADVIAQCKFEGANFYESEISDILNQYPAQLQADTNFIATVYFRELFKKEIARLSDLPDDEILRRYTSYHIEQDEQIVGIFESMRKDSLDEYKENAQMELTEAVLSAPTPIQSKASLLQQLHSYMDLIDRERKPPEPDKKQKGPEL